MNDYEPEVCNAQDKVMLMRMNGSSLLFEARERTQSISDVRSTLRENERRSETKLNYLLQGKSTTYFNSAKSLQRPKTSNIDLEINFQKVA